MRYVRRVRHSGPMKLLLMISGTLLVIRTASAAEPAASSPDTPPASSEPSVSAVQNDPYPRAETEVVITRNGHTVKVQPLKTTKTADGRRALADRLIVGFHVGSSDAEQADVHRSAGIRGGMLARPVAEIDKTAHLVDISGAGTTEAAIQAYRADPL